MKTITLIVALCLSAATLFGGDKPKTKPDFILVIEDGIIKVCDQKGDDLVTVGFHDFLNSYEDGRTFFGRDLRDATRHVALDALAAAVAGNGTRSTTVDPLTQIVTVDESNAAHPISITIEDGVGFYMLRDSDKPCGDNCKEGHRYRAEIMMISREEMAKATPSPEPTQLIKL
jgi:hypothetical protein